MGSWEREEGIKFLRKIGIRTGQSVLDFGASVGHYTIPAANIAGRMRRDCLVREIWVSHKNFVPRGLDLAKL